MTPSLSLDLAGRTHQSRLSLTSLPTLRHVATSTALSVSAARMIHCDIISSRSAAAAATPVHSRTTSTLLGALVYDTRPSVTYVAWSVYAYFYVCWTQARVLQNGWTDWDVVWGYGVVGVNVNLTLRPWRTSSPSGSVRAEPVRPTNVHVLWCMLDIASFWSLNDE